MQLLSGAAPSRSRNTEKRKKYNLTQILLTWCSITMPSMCLCLWPDFRSDPQEVHMIGVKEHSKYWEKLSNLRPPEPFFLGEIVI